MTNTVAQQPLIAVEHQSAHRQMLADIDANLTDVFTHIGTTGRLALSDLGDPLIIMDRQRFWAEVVSKINANYDVLNAYQPGLALAHVSVPASVDDSVAVLTFSKGIDTQIAAANAATAKPTNTVLPAVTGTKTSGNTITCGNGTWTGAPTFAFQWQRDGVDISGQTANTHLLGAPDQTHTVRCKVTATNAGGSTTVNTVGDLIP